MRPRASLFAALLALAAAPACALILGAEELSLGHGGDTGGGGAAPESDAGPEADAPAEAGPGPCDCPATNAWTKVFTASGDVTVAGVAADAEGNVIVAGSVTGGLDVAGRPLPAGSGGADVFVIKLDPCGEPLWLRRYGDGSDQAAIALAIDPRAAPDPDAASILVAGVYSGVLAFGGTAGDLSALSPRAFVARLDPATGEGRAAFGVGVSTTKSHRATGVAVGPDGAVYLGGTEDDDTSAFARVLDPSLDAVTSQALAPCADGAPSVALTSAGVVIAGGFRGKFDIAAGHAGGLTSAGGADVYAVLLAPDPMMPTSLADLKAVEFGDPKDQRAAAIATRPDGSVLLAGGFAGTVDFGGGPKKRISSGATDVFVAALDDQLATLWATSFGGALVQEATAIAASDSRIAVAGDYAGAIAFGSDAGAPADLESAGDVDAFLLVLDPSGAPLHAESFGGAMADHAAAVALDANGGAVVAGVLLGEADFGCARLGGEGKSIFVARRAIP